MNKLSSMAGLECPIGLFKPQETKIERLMRMIDDAGRPQQQMTHAIELTAEVQPLLRCQSFEKSSLSCVYCRSFAELRLRAAGQIVRADKMQAASAPRTEPSAPRPSSS